MIQIKGINIIDLVTTNKNQIKKSAAFTIVKKET